MVHENAPPRDDRTLWMFAVGVGLTPLIPLPWVDGVTGVWLRRRLVRQLAARRGVALVEEQVRVLTDPPPSTCLGCLGTLLVWPVKKVFRTTFFVLLVNEMLELTVETFHRSWLIDAALHGLDPLDVGHVRAALDRTCAAVELRPARRWWRGDRSGIVVDGALRHFAEELVRPAPKIDIQ
jgi:hypothetical protein